MRTRLPERNLDILRAVAVVCVLADHTLRLAYTRIGPATPDELGLFGVYLFFVHTSLVLMGSLERQGDGRHWMRDFYVRRAFRIYPLAWATIAIVVIARVPRFINQLARPATYHAASTSRLLGNLALSQNLVGVSDVLAPLWSLPIEVQMYALLPFAFLLARRGVRWVCVAGVIGIAASLIEWQVRLGSWDVPVLWRLTLLAYVPCFTAGVLAFALLRRNARYSRSPTLPSWTFPLALCAALAVLLVSFRAGGSAWAWLACLAIGLAIPVIRDASASIVTRAAHVVAQYSYGIYLTHPFAIYWAFVTLRSAPLALRIATFVALAGALPWIGYHLIEKPGIALGKRIVGSGGGIEATAPVP